MVAAPKLRAAALSDIGSFRGENEDRWLCDLSLGLFGVADGLGGLPGGGEAAQATVDTVAGAFRGLPAGAAPELEPIVQQAHRLVSALGRVISPAIGIATTLTFGHARSGVLHLAHVGDSRCYAWRDGKLFRLTEDHSVENEARRQALAGRPTRYAPENRSALTRCVGQPGALEVDLIARPLLPGDRILFCTDGITRLLSDREIGEIVGQNDDPAGVLQRLIALALKRGGPDNATGVAIFVDQPD